MKSILFATALFTAASGAAFASNDLPLNDEIKAQITEMLTADGYEVGKIKIEDGLYEAYAKKDGGKYEVLLDGEFNIVKVQD
ncbi:PepSY domain-containing protein [Celeribacter neptunius]|uniref:Peptidase propeptide and YPEB domain-containing protein n=1 Tax=Celeribacter neptunius TaxID=588602 RepID=A0A1I3KEE1_9RHOB|nr:PepSY domain-containing protein [Celeribacter neptunius]SFI70823.1 Peptidase propeptide and YPEB domain-containing protein [Celeribacter neptunius]